MFSMSRYFVYKWLENRINLFVRKFSISIKVKIPRKRAIIGH